MYGRREGALAHRFFRYGRLGRGLLACWELRVSNHGKASRFLCQFGLRAEWRQGVRFVGGGDQDEADPVDDA